MTSLATSARPFPAAAGTEPAAPPRRWHNDGTVEAADIWRILWHRRLLILATASVFAALALLYGLVTPALYSASAQILIDPRDRQVLTNDVNPSAVAPDGGVTQVESQVSVIQSAGVLLRAIAAIDLSKDPEFNGSGLLTRLADFMGRSAPASGPKRSLTPSEARTLTALRRRLAVKRADKVLVVEVVVTAQDPDKAARIANAIADAYLVDQAEARSQAAREASEALTARLAEQRKRVEAAENAVERYRAENNLTVASGRLISDQQLTEIGNQLSQAQSRSSALKAQVDQIARQRSAGGLAGATSEAMQSAVVQKLREQEGTLVQREADLQTQLGPRHPAIAAVRSQLGNIRQLITAELDRLSRSVRTDYDRALANERQLAARLETLTRQTQSSDQASVRLRELQRDLEAVRAVYANYLLRAQETREQAGLDTTNARIITRAQPPQQKSWPPMGVLLIGALGAGLGLGAGAALVREFVSPKLLSTGQVQSLLGAPVIGILPPEGEDERARNAAEAPTEPAAGSFWRRKLAATALSAIPGAAGARPAESAASAETRAEAIAGLALLRLFDVNDARLAQAPVRSVLLTSTHEDSGERSRTAFLLAHVAAMRGDRVLLIDGDVEQNQQSSLPGILDLLRGESPLAGTIHYGSRRDVALMAKGRQRPNGQKVSSRAFAIRTLSEAGKDFDLVIIDGGVLSRNIKMAPLVAVVEHILLVSRLNGAQQRDVAEIAEATMVMGRSIGAAMLIDSMGRA